MIEEKPGRQGRPNNDNGREPPAGSNHRLADDLVMGLRLYSRLPTGDRPHEKPNLSRIAMALPLASLVIGLLPAALLLGASFIGLPHLFAAGIAVAASILVSGAMAEDALADSADGLFGGGTRERRLEIMKDSRHGTYGVAALCTLLLLRAAALAAMAAIQPVAAAALWLAAMLLARSGSLWLSVSLPTARPDGLSASVGRISWRAFGLGAIFALILGLILAGPWVGFLGYLVGLVLIAIVAWLWGRFCRRMVGGQTGDLIGALQALIEITALGAFLLFV